MTDAAARRVQRALLVVPPTGFYVREGRCQAHLKGFNAFMMRPPIELAQSAAVLERAGVEVRLRDFPMEGLAWPDFEAEVQSFRPDLLLIATTVPSFRDDIEAATLARRHCPDVITVTEGTAVPWVDMKTLETCPALDIVIRKEPEQVVEELALGKSRSEILGITYRDPCAPGGFATTGERPWIADLDTLPRPARHLIRNELYLRVDTGRPQTALLMGRGCPYPCTFCLAHPAAGARARQRSPGKMVDEIIECRDRFGIIDFYLKSDLFTMYPAWVEEFCSEVDRRAPGIHWVCNSRADTLTPDLARRMRASGCWGVAFGIESGNEETLRRIRKGITLADARQAIRTCHDAGMMSYAYFMIGFPWEDRARIEATIDFACEISSNLVDFFFVYPFPGTPLFDEYRQAGLLADEIPRFPQSEPACGTLHLSAQDLKNLKSKAMRRFWLRPGQVWRNLKHVKTPSVVWNYARLFARSLVAPGVGG